MDRQVGIGIQFHFEADIQEVPTWCDAYINELQEFGKTKNEIISAYKKYFETIKNYNFQMIQNFLLTL